MRNAKLSLAFVGGIGWAAVGCSGNGKLQLRLTDAPPDTDAMATALVTIARVEAHFSGGGADKPEKTTERESGGDKDKVSGWRTVTGQPRTFDLLALQHGVSAALGELALPPGKITQIRLFIDEAGTNAITLKSGQVCALDLSSVDKNGIKINHPFKALDIGDGDTVQAVIDFDLKESVEQDGDCVYRLKPVIKLKSTTTA